MFLKRWPLYTIFIFSTLATLGSLVYSNVLHLPPCDLCWYQRAFMYPIPIISLLGILLKDTKVRYYIISLSFIGFFIALYQVLLQAGIIPSFLTCSSLVSCSEVSFRLFGLITIPQQSLLGFLSIIILSLFDIQD